MPPPAGTVAHGNHACAPAWKRSGHAVHPSTASEVLVPGLPHLVVVNSVSTSHGIAG